MMRSNNHHPRPNAIFPGIYLMLAILCYLGIFLLLGYVLSPFSWAKQTNHKFDFAIIDTSIPMGTAGKDLAIQPKVFHFFWNPDPFPLSAVGFDLPAPCRIRISRAVPGGAITIQRVGSSGNDGLNALIDAHCNAWQRQGSQESASVVFESRYWRQFTFRIELIFYPDHSWRVEVKEFGLSGVNIPTDSPYFSGPSRHRRYWVNVLPLTGFGVPDALLFDPDNAEPDYNELNNQFHHWRYSSGLGDL